jgi:ABC-type multidrug transport system fused ATPase/permease subunit
VKWVALAVFIASLVAIGSIWNLQVVLGVLAALTAIFLVVVGVTVGAVTAEMQCEGKKVLDDHTSRLGRFVWIAVWVLLIPLTLVGYLVTRLVQSRFVQRHSDQIVNGILLLLGIAVVAFVVGLLVLVFLKVGWQAFLVGLGAVVLAVGVMIGLIVGSYWLADAAANARRRKQAVVCAQQRKDPDVQRLARERCEAALHDYYVFAKAFAKDQLTYEEWTAKLEQLLGDRGMAWSDLITEYPRDHLGFIADDPAFGDMGFTLFAYALQDLHEASQTPVKRRSGRTKQVFLFVASTWFLMKSRVCPNVILPPADAVKA